MSCLWVIHHGGCRVRLCRRTHGCELFCAASKGPQLHQLALACLIADQAFVPDSASCIFVPKAGYDFSCVWQQTRPNDVSKSSDIIRMRVMPVNHAQEPTCNVLGDHGRGHKVVIVGQAHERMGWHVLRPQHQLVPLELPAESLQERVQASARFLQKCFRYIAMQCDHGSDQALLVPSV